MSLINAVLFKEGRVWIAQGIERDLCVQGRSAYDAMDLFADVVWLEAKEKGGVERIAPAPKSIRDMWLKAPVQRRFSVTAPQATHP